jgi:tRNA pseudouridine38-40 synthase
LDTLTNTHGRPQVGLTRVSKTPRVSINFFVRKHHIDTVTSSYYVLLGVHACAQVASAKIQLKPDQALDEVRDLINSHLPDNFRALDVVRTARSFCAKTSRSKVRYQYMIPSFCFWDWQEMKSLMLEIAPLDKKGRSPGSPLTEDECQQIKQRIKDYRISKDQLQSLQERLEQYAGTHQFHNFTKGLSFDQM